MIVKIGIIGANGFIGLELLRLLKLHPNIEIKYLFIHKKEITDEFNHLKDLNIEKIQTSDISKFANCDCVFLSLPEGNSQQYIKQLLGKTKIIDLGPDNRIQNDDLHHKYYNPDSDEKSTRSKFTYGFIEKNKSIIKSSSYVSNPGCFALCAQLSILPIYEKIKNINIFGITGSSGGGKIPSIKNHHSIRSKDVFSYNINNHRHLGEIFETYGKLNSNNLSFIPTSGSFIRGIFLNCFVETNQNYHFDEISNDFSNTIKNSKFYRHQDEIRISNVIGSNYFDINFKFLPNNNLLIQSCLDNLVKGAAGNAIQCMNIMFNIDEDTGLNKLIPMYI